MAAAGAIPASAHGSPAQDDLLHRYRPALRYSEKEKYFAQPVSRAYGDPAQVDLDRVYGHIAKEADETWLQYWLFFAYNAQDRGLVRTGRHEGDWELFQLRLDDAGVPDLATLAQHSWAEGCAWDSLERDGNAPVLYVANGSHALYSAPGTWDRPFPDPNDEADGEGREVRPKVQQASNSQPAWVAYDGRWGSSRAGPIPGEQSSPFGPRFQPSGAWAAPATFHADRAVACGSGPPGRWWTLPVPAAALLAIGAIALLLRRRLRSGRAGA
jgi:hypothetical protein